MTVLVFGWLQAACIKGISLARNLTGSEIELNTEQLQTLVLGLPTQRASATGHLLPHQWVAVK